MNNILKTFYDNEIERETVKQFMIEVLGDIAKGRAFEGKPTQGIQEARELIEKTFDKLHEDYAIIKAPLPTNSR